MTVDPISSIFSDAIRGMQTGIERVDFHAEVIAGGEVNPENMVGLIEGERTFDANLASMRVADEMVGTLLDTLA